MVAKWKCPHCGNINTVSVPEPAIFINVAFKTVVVGICEEDDGGCGEMVPVRVERKIIETAIPVTIKPFSCE